MLKEIEDAIKAEFDHRLEKVLNVVSIFNYYFGEDKVDVQGISDAEHIIDFIKTHTLSYEGTLINDVEDINEVNLERLIDRVYEYYSSEHSICIYVHFPKVTITNEYGSHVDIEDLYAKVPINSSGCMYGYFSLMRTTYSKTHFLSRYAHSHLPSLRYDLNGLNLQFQEPCLGTGPIRNTQSSLNQIYDENTWELFAIELAKYVTVESLAGGPYISMSSIGEVINVPLSYSIEELAYVPVTRSIKEFTEYYLSNIDLKYNYIHGRYGIAMTYEDFILDISNKYIEWANDNNVRNAENNTQKVIKKGLHFYPATNNGGENEFIDRYNGQYLFTFKGEPVNLKITDVCNPNDSITILKKSIINNILYFILKEINLNYGTKYYRTKAAEEKDTETPKVHWIM